jgi:hypothetical protein
MERIAMIVGLLGTVYNLFCIIFIVVEIRFAFKLFGAVAILFSTIHFLLNRICVFWGWLRFFFQPLIRILTTCFIALSTLITYSTLQRSKNNRNALIQQLCDCFYPVPIILSMVASISTMVRG